MSVQAIIAERTLKSIGWEFQYSGSLPRKFVGLAAPHTSNLDGVLMVMMAESIGLKMSWMVKDAVDQPGLGKVARTFGAVFIDRSAHHGVVDQMIHEFERRDEFCLMIPPEGTRSRREYWKSGFYHIALGAKVPIVPGFLDYALKRGGFGEPIELTGDVPRDMDVIRDFYETGNFGPRHPEKFGPIRLREEEGTKE